MYNSQYNSQERYPNDAGSKSSCACYLHKLPAYSSYFSSVQIATDTSSICRNLSSNNDNACISPLTGFLGPRREIPPTRLVLITAFPLHEMIS
jgi:hypothetical protein